MGRLTKKIGEPDDHVEHIEDHIYDLKLPAFVRTWITINRLPAIEKWAMEETFGVMKITAEHEGKRVRVTMASRMGDCGITTQMSREHGYDKRVMFSTLSKFKWERKDG